MSHKIVPGMFVWYRPKRNIFAASSGSFTGKPARYDRPCVVSKIVNNHAFLKPITGAKLNSGHFGPRTGMRASWWAAVKFSNPLIATPSDTVNLGTIPRAPIVVSIPVDISTIKVNYKPSYMWDGDEGEPVTLEELAQLTPLEKSLWFCDEGELAKLEDFANFWKIHDPPQDL